MGEIRLSGPVKLVMGILARDREWLGRAGEEIRAVFGRTDIESPTVPFEFTDYYAGEMGEVLLRQWVGFESLVVPDGLVGIKLKTNLLEQELSPGPQGGKRPVNLDPGYVNDSRLILATTKDFAHRIYLGSGIYGEVALVYKEGAFRALEWTYPDYRSKESLEFFLGARKLFLTQRERHPQYPEKA